MLRALFPQAVFIPKERSIHAPINLRSSSIISEVDALIDSGATDNFISPAVIQHFGIPTRTMNKPRTIRKVDASTPDAHYKPLARTAVDPATMKESLEDANYATILSKYVNLKPEDQATIRRTSKATTLAAEKADKTVRTWQEQVPTEYHCYGKVFSEEAS